MNLFGVGAAEAGLVLVIALILVGPQRFPEIARQGGKWYRIARRFTAEVTKDLRLAVDEIEGEIRSEADGLQSVRELGNIDAELKTARADVQAATESIAQAADEPRPGTADATNAAAAATVEAATAPSDGTPDDSAAPAPAEVDDAPADPFKALEARQAAERGARPTNRNGSDGTNS